MGSLAKSMIACLFLNGQKIFIHQMRAQALLLNLIPVIFRQHVADDDPKCSKMLFCRKQLFLNGFWLNLLQKVIQWLLKHIPIKFHYFMICTLWVIHKKLKFFRALTRKNAFGGDFSKCFISQTTWKRKVKFCIYSWLG